MTKSYKMLVLLGMLNEDAFPGEITIDTLPRPRRAAEREPHPSSPGTSSRARNPLGSWNGEQIDVICR